MVDSWSVLDLPADARGLIVATDTETSGLHPDNRLPEGGRCRVAVVSLAWCDEDGTHTRAYPFDQGIRDKLSGSQDTLFATADPNLGEEDWIRLLDWLSKQRLVFHNAKFDLLFLRAGTRHWDGVDLAPYTIWDTMVAAKAFDPLEPVSLDDVERRYFGTTTKKDTDAGVKRAIAALPKGTRRTGGEGNHDLIDWESMKEYAANDARLTIEAYWFQQEVLDLNDGSVDLREVAEGQQLVQALHAIERRGISFDTKLAELATERLTKRMAELEAEIPFSTTPAGAKHFYFDQCGYKPFHETDKGAPQFALEDQALAVGQGWPHAAEYAELQKIKKAVSMWYEGWALMTGDDGRIRTTYRQGKVRTGRLSVERVQLQAIPKDDKAIELPGGDRIPKVRALFKPEDGHILWNLDLGQAELRIASHYAGCEEMSVKLQAGADLHGDTTRQIFGIEPGRDPGRVEHNYKKCICPVCKEFDVKRDIAKRLTFGGIFQIGAKKFAETLASLAGIYMTEGECKPIVDNWRRMYPEFGVAYRQSEQLVRRQGWVPLLNGRYRSYFRTEGYPIDYPNSAWNRRVQGSLAKFNQLWLIAAEGWMADLPGHVVLNVHDSIVLEVPEGDDEEIAQEVASRTSAMASEMFETPMTVDVKGWEYAGENEYGDFVGAL